MALESSGLKAPFPYFGGKSKVAGVVWERFGDVRTYVEPFFGSGAVLLGRPEWHLRGNDIRFEFANDKNGFVANFWRSLQCEPGTVASHADYPVFENDKHARHAWLMSHKADLVARLEGNPDYYDAKIAGWWAWGASISIGNVMDRDSGAWSVVDEKLVRSASAPNAITRSLFTSRNSGVIRSSNSSSYLYDLAARLKGVKVACGDWSRVVRPAAITHGGATGIFLDPPYTHEGRDASLYAEDDVDIAAAVAGWAVANGDHPDLRIAYCGYEDGAALFPETWEKIAWAAHGGYGNLGEDNQNKHRETIWFSPHCLKASEQLGMF